MGNTHITLVKKLEKILANYQAKHVATGQTTKDATAYRLEGLIKRAKRGYYHDFANDEVATPKMALVADLRAAGLPKTAQEVIEGKYDDESPDDDPKEFTS
jgi:hypothetical protein